MNTMIGVRLEGCHFAADLFWKEELTGMRDVSADVDLEMNVDGASGIPAGVDSDEPGATVFTSHLDSSQESLLIARVHLGRTVAARPARRWSWWRTAGATGTAGATSRPERIET